MRKHRYKLEAIQRTHLSNGLERMEFTAETVASMLQDIADCSSESNAFLLHAVVNALLGKDDDHVLILKQKKPGKYRSPTEQEASYNRSMKWLWWLAHLEKQGIKTESAVAEIAEKEKVKRTTIFAEIAVAEERLSWIRRLDMKFSSAEHLQNPRPTKNENS